jgi:hypothetical protein
MYDDDAPNTTYGGHYMPFDMAANRLKSLKGRVWSEEDEVKDNWEYIQDFIGKLGHFPKDSDELDVLINYVLVKKQKFA